jgi:hypothetical protein
MNDNSPFYKDLLSPLYTVVSASIKTSLQQKYLNHSALELHVSIRPVRQTENPASRKERC